MEKRDDLLVTGPGSLIEVIQHWTRLTVSST
jgi:hypothetical protein